MVGSNVIAWRNGIPEENTCNTQARAHKQHTEGPCQHLCNVFLVHFNVFFFIHKILCSSD